MSEIRTTIELSGTSGFCDWGAKTREQMIASYRRIAETQKLEAEKILSAKDSDFKVWQHRGYYRQYQVVVLNHDSQSANASKAGGE